MAPTSRRPSCHSCVDGPHAVVLLVIAVPLAPHSRAWPAARVMGLSQKQITCYLSLLQLHHPNIQKLEGRKHRDGRPQRWPSASWLHICLDAQIRVGSPFEQEQEGRGAAHPWRLIPKLPQSPLLSFCGISGSSTRFAVMADVATIHEAR